MATFLDVTALESFSNIFVFLFVWLAVYAILTYTKVLGQNQFINILIGLVMAIFVLFSQLATKIVLDIVPWMALLFVFIILISMATQSFGASFEASAYGGLKYVLLVFVVIAIIVGALSEVRQSVSVPGDNETSTDFDRDFSQTVTVFFHPNFLGAMFLLALAVFTIALLASKQA
ncbi:hypothetical protein J4458_06545 [Candidatus Woesearchaeota archaeon]|nr:hypothetical protein [Candidatus Woesearchaeota archaeon]